METMELLKEQFRVRCLAELIHEDKPDNWGLTFYTKKAEADPVEIRHRLLERNAFQELLLPHGANLGIQDTQDYYRYLDLDVDDSYIQEVLVSGWLWEYEWARLDQETKEVLTDPNKKDWAAELDIIFSYANNGELASEKLTTYTGSYSPSIPSLGRDISSIAYAETGYEGHNQKHLNKVELEDLNFFLDLVEELIT